MKLLTFKSSPGAVMGSVPTQDFLSQRRIDNRKGVLRERPVLCDVTNVSRDEAERLPETDSTAIKQSSGKKQRLMHPVRPIDTNIVATTKSANGKAPAWTPKEDEALRNAVKMNNGRNWKLIAESVPSRSDVQCLHRWQKVLNPILVKGYWTKEEDVRTIELVQMFGTKRWAAVARCLPGRNGKQCRESRKSLTTTDAWSIDIEKYGLLNTKKTVMLDEYHRWCNHLDPRISRDPWTEDEDMMLFLSHSTWGNKWAEIAKLLPGRSDNGVKNRWNTSLRKRANAMEQLAKSLNLQSPVMPTATHPDLMAGGDDTAGQFEQEEYPREVHQGFKSYATVVVHNSPPNPQRRAN